MMRSMLVKPVPWRRPSAGKKHYLPVTKISRYRLARSVVPLCSAVFGVALYTGAALAQTIDFGNYHALLIANENYQHWEDLHTPHEDVEELARTLEAHYAFRVKVVRDATRNDIVDELETFRTALTEKDNLLIYYAGHGKVRNDSGYWIGVDASKESRSRWLSFQTVSDLLDARNGMKARHVLLVADSCYSGAIFRSGDDISGAADVESRPHESRAEALERLSRLRARKAMTSGGTEPVIDRAGSARHSIFASELIAKLKVNDRVLESAELYRQIKGDVHSRARRVVGAEAQFPGYDLIHGTGHDPGAQFLFVPRNVTVASVTSSDVRPTTVVIRGGTPDDGSTSRPPTQAPIAFVRASRPSFDCRKASTPQEHVFCAVPELGDADYQMAQTYRALRGRLTARERTKLRRDQMAWLKRRDRICPATASDLSNERRVRDLSTCLMDEVTRRNDFLGSFR